MSLFRLLLKEIINSGILEGKTGKMAFSYSLPLMLKDRYHLAGQFLPWNIANGGCAMPVLSKTAFGFLTNFAGQSHQSVLEEVVDIPVDEIRNAMTKVH